MNSRIFLLIGASAFALAIAVAQAPPKPAPAKPVSYQKQIKPLFTKSCIKCHRPEDKDADLDLTTPAGIKKGGESGVMYTAGKGKDSLLVKYIDGREKPRMPKKADPLTAAQIKMVQDWIDQGAKFD